MKNLFVVCGIIFILLIGGCSNQTDTSDTTKPITELALVLSDLPEGYKIKERTPRLKSDVSKEAIDLGWEDGYYIRFARIGEDIFDATVIEQFISIYPINDVKKVLDLPEQSNENVTYEELPSSDLGVESKAYRITYIDEFGTQERVYQIEFFKKNVYQEIDMSGTATDYELLKEIVKKSIKKI